MRWQVVVQPIGQGGLGLGRVKERNLALLSKCLWRFSVEQGFLWHSIIRSRYGTNANGWSSNQNPHRPKSLCWNHINQVSPLFFPHIHFPLGNRTNIRFWKDLWGGYSTLELAYPRIFRLVVDKNAKVFDILSQGPNGVIRNLPFSRNLFEWKVDLVSRFMDDLHLVFIFSSSVDSWIWFPSYDGRFTCKSFFSILTTTNTSQSLILAHNIWKSAAPSRVKVVDCPP